MQNSYSKVIGYWAYRSRAEVVCAEHDACLIAGSEEAMREYVREFTGQTADKHTIRKTRFGEILDGIRIGAAYAFDEEAYSRFLPLARGAGFRRRTQTSRRHVHTDSGFSPFDIYRSNLLLATFRRGSRMRTDVKL